MRTSNTNLDVVVVVVAILGDLSLCAALHGEDDARALVNIRGNGVEEWENIM